MAMKYLLDTNICIALLRGDRNVADILIEKGERNCYISVITLLELMYGAYNSRNVEKERHSVEELVSHFPIVALDNCSVEYASNKVKLRKAGTPVDEFDLLIASNALHYNLTLVTDNTKHFKRIDGLKLENWIVR